MAASVPASTSTPQRTSGVVSCGNCLEVQGYLINPVKLQCGHVFCETCLQDHHKNLQILTCFTCKQEMRARIEDLPSAMGEKAAFCDSCSKKSINKMSAVVHCSICVMKFCCKHEQSHADCMSDHEMLPISSHILPSSSVADEQRFCKTHKDQPLIIGCSRCWIICCTRCMSSLDPCTNVSGDHKLIAIEDLADLAKYKLEPYKKQAEEKFEELSALVKDTTIQISQWDVDTEANVRIIHQARDEQISAIRVKYAAVEREYVTSRAETKHKMTEFIETDAGVKLSEFNDQLKKLRECVSKKHPVDLVTEKEEIKTKIDQLIKSELPNLMITDQLKISKTDKTNREAEVQISPDHDIRISQSSGLSNPTSLVLQQEVTPGDTANSVCHYKGYTYVGMDNGSISRISTDGNVNQTFITGLGGEVTSIKAHNDSLYILRRGSPQKVFIYKLEGQIVKSWDHSDTDAPWSWGNKICVTKNQVIVADLTNKRFCIYSLSGDLEKYVSCPSLPASGHLSVAPIGLDSMLVASECGGISTFNHQTGQVTWASAHKVKHTAVAALNEENVLLSGSNGKKGMLVERLNIKTDEMTELNTSDSMSHVSSTILDLHIHDDTLIVPFYSGGKVQQYKMLYN